MAHIGERWTGVQPYEELDRSTRNLLNLFLWFRWPPSKTASWDASPMRPAATSCMTEVASSIADRAVTSARTTVCRRNSGPSSGKVAKHLVSTFCHYSSQLECVLARQPCPLILAVLKAKIKIKNIRFRAGIGPQPTISLRKWQSGPSSGTPRGRGGPRNKLKIILSTAR